MKKQQSPFEKTVALWTSVPSEQKALRQTVEKAGYTAVVCRSAAEVLAVRCIAVFANADPDTVPTCFFRDHPHMAGLVVSGEVLFVFVNGKRPTPFSKNSPQFAVTDRRGITEALERHRQAAEPFLVRRRAMATQLGRLLWMQTQLLENGTVDRADYMHRSGVSRRTYYRDLQTVEALCRDLYGTGTGE